MANKFYGATSLTGGASGSLDNIDGAILAGGDGAFVIDSTTNVIYIYMLDATDGSAESSPDIIAPDTNPSTKRWLLTSIQIPNITVRTAFQLGAADGTGANFTLYSNTSGDTVVFDPTGKTFTLTDIQLVANDVDINGGAIDGVTINGSAACTIGGGFTWSAAQDLNSQALTNVNIDSGDVATGVTLNITDTAGYFAGTEVETILAEIGQELLQHNIGGWEDASLVALSTDSGNPPTITLTFTGTVGYYSSGVRYTQSGTDDKTLTNTSGIHVLYYDGSTLTEAVNPSAATLDTIFKTKCIACMVYWETNTDTAPVLASELHGLIMSPDTHHYLHDVQGTQWKSGGNISGYTLNNAADASVVFDLTDISIYDEDLEIDITDGAAANQYEQVLTGDAEVPVLYHDDVDGSWIEAAASTLPYLVGGTPRIQYQNDDGDGTWSLTEAGAAEFVNYWLIATNDWQYPVKMVPGTASYSTKALAESGRETELTELGSFPTLEYVVLYSFLLQHSVGGTKNIKIVDIIDYRFQNISPAQAAIAAADHGSLAGLADDDHIQYLLVDGTRALNGAWDMNSKALTNVNIDSGSFDGATIGAASPSTIVGTTIDATTDFTVGGTVITDNTITDDGTLLLVTSTGVQSSNQNFYIGADDTQRGTLSIFGHATGQTQGGTINLYTSFDHDDGGLELYTIRVVNDDLYIGPGGNTDAIKLVGTGGNDATLQVTVNSTFTGTTIADLGTVTTVDIDGGTIDGVTLGDTTLADAAEITIDDAPASDHTGTGLIITDTVDSNTYGVGGCLVKSADGNWDDADADAEATVGYLGMVLETGTGSKKILLKGFVRDDTWNWTPGEQLYVSATAGSITNTAPSTSGQFVQVVGWAHTADIVYFDPSPDYVELA